MARSRLTIRSLQEAFSLANCHVPRGLVTEIAYDKKAGNWNAFIINSQDHYTAIGSDPVAAITNLCTTNEWIKS